MPQDLLSFSSFFSLANRCVSFPFVVKGRCFFFSFRCVVFMLFRFNLFRFLFVFLSFIFFPEVRGCVSCAVFCFFVLSSEKKMFFFFEAFPFVALGFVFSRLRGFGIFHKCILTLATSSYVFFSLLFGVRIFTKSFVLRRRTPSQQHHYHHHYHYHHV